MKLATAAAAALYTCSIVDGAKAHLEGAHAVHLIGLWLQLHTNSARLSSCNSLMQRFPTAASPLQIA